jgi:hypothetical protein
MQPRGLWLIDGGYNLLSFVIAGRFWNLEIGPHQPGPFKRKRAVSFFGGVSFFLVESVHQYTESVHKLD